MSKPAKDGRKLAVGALIAAGIGYAAGVLTAPKSGKDTRKDIQGAASAAKAKAEKSLKGLHSELGELIETGKSKATDVKDLAKKDLTDALTKGQHAKEKVREILSALHEGDADDKDLKKAVSEATKAVEHLKKYVGKTVQAKK